VIGLWILQALLAWSRNFRVKLVIVAWVTWIRSGLKCFWLLNALVKLYICSKFIGAFTWHLPLKHFWYRWLIKDNQRIDTLNFWLSTFLALGYHQFGLAQTYLDRFLGRQILFRNEGLVETLACSLGSHQPCDRFFLVDKTVTRKTRHSVHWLYCRWDGPYFAWIFLGLFKRQFKSRELLGYRLVSFIVEVCFFNCFFNICFMAK